MRNMRSRLGSRLRHLHLQADKTCQTWNGSGSIGTAPIAPVYSLLAKNRASRRLTLLFRRALGPRLTHHVQSS